MRQLLFSQRLPIPVPVQQVSFWLWLLFLLAVYSEFEARLSAAETATTNQDLRLPVEPTEIPLEDLMKLEVSTPSRFPQRPREAPASVTVVTADEIKKYGHRTLAEILRSVRGLYVTYDRAYEFLGTRGFNRGDFNSRMLVLVDGHRINNSLSDGALIGTAFILDVDLIDHIEILRGPASVLYGNNAFFGVINVITKRGGDYAGAGVEGSAEVGTFDTVKGRVTFGHLFTNQVEVLVSATTFDSRGDDRLFYKEFNNPANNNGVAEDLDRDQFRSVFGKLRYREFTLQGGFVSRDKSVPTAPFGVKFNDPRSETLDDRSYLSLGFTHEFPGILELSAQVYYDRHDFSVFYPLPNQLFREDQTGEWWGTEVKLQKRLFDRHTLILGGEYRDDFRQERKVFDVASGAATINQDRRTENYGVYVLGDFALLTNRQSLRLNAGVRYDQYGRLEPTANPRAALIYDPVPGSTFKAIYGTAFRAPNFFELSDPRFQDIEPETITTYELAYEQELGGHLRSSVSIFFNEIDDLIGFAGGRFRNLSGAVSRGLEVGLTGRWRGGIQTRISYSFQETEDRETDRVLVDSPRHLAKANLIVPVWPEKVFAGLEFQYLSKRATARVGSGGNTVMGQDVPGFGLFNFTLFSQKLLPGLEASVTIHNLLDQGYSDPSTLFHLQEVIPQDGRTFRVKLTYHF